MLNYALSIVGMSSATSASTKEAIDLQSPSPKRRKNSHDQSSAENSVSPNTRIDSDNSVNRIGIRKLGTSPYCLSQKKTKLFKDEDGYMYHKDREKSSANEVTYYYRCKDSKCPGRYAKVIDSSGENVVAESITKAHHADCQPDPDDVIETVRQFRSEVLTRVEQSSVSLGAAYKEVAMKLQDQLDKLPGSGSEAAKGDQSSHDLARATRVLQSLPTARSMKTTASRVRNSKYPSQPLDANAFVNSLPEALKEGIFFGEKYSFFQVLLRCPTKPDCVAVIFGDKDSLILRDGQGILQRIGRLYVDGTFKIVPQPFEQLFTIGYLVEGRMFPAFYCLLTNKRTETYRLVFDYLFSQLTVNSTVTPVLMSIMSDFEHQIRNAISQACNANKIMKGLNIRIEGCYFHYVQALHHNARQMGVYYHLKESLNTPKYYGIMKLLAGLANLRVEHIPQAYAQIRERYKDAINASASLPQFFAYYEREWLTDIQKWNVFDALGYRTNNHMEGWHRGVNEAVQNRTRNIWLFVQTLRDDCFAKKMEYQQFLSGGEVRPQPSKKAKEDERLLALKIAHYKSGALKPWDFLKSVANVE